MKLSQIKALYKNFGAGITIPLVCASSFRGASSWKHKNIISYLKDKCGGVIHDWRDMVQDSCWQNSGPIWCMWWQGEDMPETVRVCVSSMRQHAGVRPVKILTSQNFREYITLPEHIMRKFESGAITVTHLSDIIRVSLLHKYGGLWLDASVFVAGGMPEISGLGYYTVRREDNPRSRNVSHDRWTGFIQGGAKGNVLCGFMRDFLFEYWIGHEMMIDYFLLDYAMEMALTEIPECMRLFEAIPFNNKNVHGLHDVMSEEYSHEKYESLMEDTCFFKLAWRTDYRKSIKGRETFCGHIFREYE